MKQAQNLPALQANEASKIAASVFASKVDTAEKIRLGLAAEPLPATDRPCLAKDEILREFAPRVSMQSKAIEESQLST